MKKFKINMHITEQCNYHCRHCFAHFGTKQHLSIKNAKKIIENIAESNLINEINIAGGEPFCHPQLDKIVNMIHEHNLHCSIISNGSLLSADWIKRNISKLTTFGFSIDSIQPETMRGIGRCSKNEQILNMEDICSYVNLMREENPLIKIKINSVLSKLTDKTLPHEFFRKKLRVDRWKLLRAKTFSKNSFSNKDIVLTDDEWQELLTNNNIINGNDKTKFPYIVIEESLVSSYFIVDPEGNLLDNSKNENYVSVGNLLSKPLEEILHKLNFNYDLYNKRYFEADKRRNEKISQKQNI